MNQSNSAAVKHLEEREERKKQKEGYYMYEAALHL
jgi:hypothetical protein